MGATSLILGFISIFVPLIWFIAYIPAIMGLILGIISLVKKKAKGQSIAGIILCSITLINTLCYIYYT